MARVVIIKNLTNEAKEWGNHGFNPLEEREIPLNRVDSFVKDEVFIQAISSDPAAAVVGNGNEFFYQNIDMQLKWIIGSYSEVTPTAPKNEYELLRLGRAKSNFLSSGYCEEIIITNKIDNTFTYSSLLIEPEVGSQIACNEDTVWTYITEVDTVNKKITVEDASNMFPGVVLLSNPVNIDYILSTSYGDTLNLWGCYFTAKNYGEDDHVILQVIDTYGITGLPAGTVVKQYDECWVNQIDQIIDLGTPDGAPGIISATFTLRVAYYPTLTTETNVSVWLDYKLLKKD